MRRWHENGQQGIAGRQPGRSSVILERSAEFASALQADPNGLSSVFQDQGRRVQHASLRVVCLQLVEERVTCCQAEKTIRDLRTQDTGDNGRRIVRIKLSISVPLGTRSLPMQKKQEIHVFE